MELLPSATTPFRVSKNPQIVKTQVFDDLWVSPYVLGLHNIDILNNYRIRLLRKVFCLTAQLDPLEYPYTLRGRAHCLCGPFDLCSLSKNEVF